MYNFAYSGKQKKLKYQRYRVSDDGDEINKLNFQNAVALLKEYVDDNGILTVRATDSDKWIIKNLYIAGLIEKKRGFYVIDGKIVYNHFVLTELGKSYLPNVITKSQRLAEARVDYIAKHSDDEYDEQKKKFIQEFKSSEYQFKLAIRTAKKRYPEIRKKLMPKRKKGAKYRRRLIGGTN